MSTEPRSERIFFCELSKIPTDRGLKFRFDSHAPVALWRVGDEVFATDDTCTHGQASLAQDGYLEEYVVECAMHQGCFDIRDGRATAPPCTVPLRTYDVDVVDGRVFVKVE